MPRLKHHKFRCEVETCRKKVLRCWFPASMTHEACRSGHGGEQHIGERLEIPQKEKIECLVQTRPMRFPK